MRRIFLSTTALDPTGDALPTEARLFKAGLNTSEKGDVVLDEEALARVLDRFQTQGVDLMIDLQHDSIDGATLVARDNAADAMGWAQLEGRNGELWLTQIKWSSEGERRLRARLQRYLSPAFTVDEQDRPTEMINVALCSMPATHDAQALVAATKILGKLPMDPEQVKKALEAIKNGDSEAALGLLEAMVASAAGGAEPASDEPSPDDAALAEVPDEEPPPEEDEAMSALCALTGTDSPAAAVAAALEKLTASQKASELALAKERQDLVARLVQLRAETPATAWEDPKTRLPVKRLADEPLESLKGRVKALSAVRTPAAPEPPSTPAAGELTASQKHFAKGLTPEQLEVYTARCLARKAQ